MNVKTTLLVFAACLVVVALASAFASSHPDGLEWAAERLGFMNSAVEAGIITAPLPNYSLLPVKSPFWSTFSAGAIGTLVVFLISWIISILFFKPR